jgi:hypothetical protein
MRKVTLLLSMCLLGGLAMVGCKAMQENQAKADKTAKEVLDLIAAGNSDKLYDQYMTSLCQGATGRERNAKLVNAFRNRLGKPKSFNLVSQQVVSSNDVIRGAYVYQVQWEKGSGTLQLTTVTTGGEIKLDGFRVDSDAFFDDATTAPTTKPQSTQP